MHTKTFYFLMIQYLPNLDSPNSIEQWGCMCHSGLRNVDCCSNIASIINFLKIPGKRLNHILLTNESEIESDNENDVASTLEHDKTQKILKRNVSASFEYSKQKKSQKATFRTRWSNRSQYR